MRVAFLVSRFPNPSETWIVAQIEGLLERGASVDVAAFAAGDADQTRALTDKWGARLGVHIAPMPKSLLGRILAAPASLGRAPRGALDAGRFGEDAASLRLLVAAARWPAALAERRIWLAHYGRWGEFACALRALGLIAGPIATMFHGRDMSVYLRKRPRAYRRLLAEGDLFLPISELWRARLLALGAPPTRTITHRMGVDVSRFAFQARTRRGDEPARFIGVGRMVEKKGFDDAIDALAAVRGATLTLIGDGPLRARLEARAQTRQMHERVAFTGMLTNARVAEELARAHIFILPSKTARDGDMEGVPVSLMEAMAQGLPVISTRHSAIPELVEHGVSGLLSPEGDVAALGANMADMAGAPERWATFGAAGAKRVRADFDVARWNDLLASRLGALTPRTS